MNDQVIHDSTRKERGKGNGGADLPEGTGHNNEADIGNSLPGTSMGDVMKGYCPDGSISGDTHSHSPDAKPGSNNKNSVV